MAQRILKHRRLAVLTAIALGSGVVTAQAQAPENCRGKETFVVGLEIVGTPKDDVAGTPADAFRIVGRCGQTEIVRCQAKVGQDGTGGCNALGFVEGLRGVKNCVIGPKNANSDAAGVTAMACFAD